MNVIFGEKTYELVSGNNYVTSTTDEKMCEFVTLIFANKDLDLIELATDIDVALEQDKKFTVEGETTQVFEGNYECTNVTRELGTTNEVHVSFKRIIE